MTWSGDTATIEANVPAAELQAAVDAAPADTSADNAITLRDRAEQALATNAAFIVAAKPATAAAQASAAYDASVRHARQINGVIRLLLGKLDATD